MPRASGRTARRRGNGLASGFKDHFSAQSRDYARFRPQYPPALFEAIAAHLGQAGLALDVATGNGQLALDLAELVERVIATDASAEQIGNAMQHPRIEYRVAPAEDSGLPDQSVDLLTVGQALHWFDLERFAEEASRVIAPGGLLVAVSYAVCEISPAIDAVVDQLYTGLLDEFWPPERALVENRYEGIRLPGDALDLGEHAMAASWSVDDMLGYLRTWSASKRFERARGRDPVDEIEAELSSAWGEGENHVAWPLTIRASRL